MTGCQGPGTTQQQCHLAKTLTQPSAESQRVREATRRCHHARLPPAHEQEPPASQAGHRSCPHGNPLPRLACSWLLSNWTLRGWQAGHPAPLPPLGRAANTPSQMVTPTCLLT